jgi:predicted DNA-binding protein (MmcQ/YjbR family)
MNIESYRSFCLSFQYVTEEFPFDDKTLVFKVQGKIFALMNVDDFRSINLKCNPERAIELRETHSSIRPGYHMNKKHWNTVDLFGDVSDDELFDLTKHSYELVFQSLPKKLREI